MFLLHSKLLGTSTFVTIALLFVCIYYWIRSLPVGSLAQILHRIVGLLFVSAAVLGGGSSEASDVAPLHIVYASLWLLVWFFLWKGVNSFIPPKDQPRFWVVTSIILIVLLHRIDVTGQ